ncbi:NAD(P)H-quinone oxidoreductase subunit F [Acaryochloris sp. CCMEE 5410]|nr:NAD(P)H-quinone oxidoreductase subunit F [Acaryochloris sp. CCMEE 5410]KAI9132658.1 NAD(P)H-quinone oxidoreductase subunit F [Acaryochloris sp. CCMEE 5410]
MLSQFLLEHIWWIPFFGLLGALFSLPWSLGLIRRSGPRPVAYFNILMTLLSCLHGTIVFKQVLGQPSQELVYEWLQVADLNLTFAIEISPVSVGALELVTFLSLLTQVFAIGYMDKDWSVARFFGLMGFFEGALAGIAISDSLILSYALLEMLTFSSYLLVGFWYAQPLVVTAARDAFLTKRVGDIILLMGLVALTSYGAGLTFSDLRAWSEATALPPLTDALLGLALIAGPTGNCAQFPLNLWLDEAMEGPNPAGVMRNTAVVSIGAYFLIKLQPIFSLSLIASDTLLIIGGVTAVGASLISIAQVDIKRALSHSTSAYLGLVFIAVGLGQVNIALSLLLTHAIAKALLFFSISSVILGTNSQDMTEMGGLWSRLPATTTAFVVGAASLVVILPMGFFRMMQQWLTGGWNMPVWLFVLLVFVNTTSAISLTRIFRLIFLGQRQPKTRRVPEVPWLMALPMVTMTVAVLAFPLMPLKWSLWLHPLPSDVVFSEYSIPYGLPILVASGVIGVILGSVFELRRSLSRPTTFYLRFFQDLLAYDFYIERVYEYTVVAIVRLSSEFTTYLDKYVVDGIVNFVGKATLLSGQGLKYGVSGQSQSYLLTIMIGISAILWLLLRDDWSAIVGYWSELLSQ